MLSRRLLKSKSIRNVVGYQEGLCSSFGMYNKTDGIYEKRGTQYQTMQLCMQQCRTINQKTELSENAVVRLEHNVTAYTKMHFERKRAAEGSLFETCPCKQRKPEDLKWDGCKYLYMWTAKNMLKRLLHKSNIELALKVFEVEQRNSLNRRKNGYMKENSVIREKHTIRLKPSIQKWLFEKYQQIKKFFIRTWHYVIGILINIGGGAKKFIRAGKLIMTILILLCYIIVLILFVFLIN